MIAAGLLSGHVIKMILLIKPAGKPYLSHLCRYNVDTRPGQAAEQLTLGTLGQGQRMVLSVRELSRFMMA